MTMAALARSNQELERFARAVSHELVQPLGSITTYAQLIKDQSDGDVQRCANRIVEVGSRMAGMLRQHLDRCPPCDRRYRFEVTLRRYVRVVASEPIPDELVAKLAGMRASGS